MGSFDKDEHFLIFMDLGLIVIFVSILIDILDYVVIITV